jgi:hypothetical protein
MGKVIKVDFRFARTVFYCIRCMKTVPLKGKHPMDYWSFPYCPECLKR